MYKYLLTVVFLSVVPINAFASDFGPILIFFHGLTIIVGIVICITAFKTAKQIENQYMKLAVKCAAICICFTPASIGGGHGDFTGVVLEAMLFGMVGGMLGGDTKYLTVGFGYFLASFTVVYLISVSVKRNEKRFDENA